MKAEMERYTEVHRDQLEQQLAAEANKKELDYRSSNGITVIAYWLMKENVCTIFVSDDRTNSACEFPVPNDEVMTWFQHPCAHPDYVAEDYSQNQNGEGYGA